MADDSHSAMMRSKQASGIAMVIALCLLAAAPADARRPAITGSIDQPGFTLVALGSNEASRAVRVHHRFKLVPPARTVTLQLRDRSGTLFGPVKIRAKGGGRVLAVKEGAKLGLIRIQNNFGASARKVARKWLVVRGGSKPRNGKRKKKDRGKSGKTGDEAPVSSPANESPPTSVDQVSTQDGLTVGNDADDSTADAALVVAIAAAAIALLSLLTQAVTRIPRRRRRVDVVVGLALPVYQDHTGEWTIFIELVNRTEQPIRWTGAELELKDGRLMHFVEYPRGGELPAVVQPDDSHRTWASCTELERNGLDLHERVVAVAKTAGGDVFHSEPTRLRR
jgi:hypothetical protein